TRNLHRCHVEQFCKSHGLETGCLSEPAEAFRTHLAAASQLERDCPLECSESWTGNEQLAAGSALSCGHIASEAPAVQNTPGSICDRLEGGLAAGGTGGLLHSSPDRKSTRLNSSH